MSDIRETLDEIQQRADVELLRLAAANLESLANHAKVNREAGMETGARDRDVESARACAGCLKAAYRDQRTDVPRLVAALRAVLHLADDADSAALQILTYGTPTGRVSTIELRRRITEAWGEDA